MWGVLLVKTGGKMPVLVIMMTALVISYEQVLTHDKTGGLSIELLLHRDNFLNLNCVNYSLRVMTSKNSI